MRWGFTAGVLLRHPLVLAGMIALIQWMGLTQLAPPSEAIAKRCCEAQIGCSRMIERKAKISRDQWSQILAVQSTQQANIEAFLGPPFCELPPSMPGFVRFAYPTTWDGSLWIVIVYSTNGAYAGYDFIY